MAKMGAIVNSILLFVLEVAPADRTEEESSLDYLEDRVVAAAPILLFKDPVVAEFLAKEMTEVPQLVRPEVAVVARV